MLKYKGYQGTFEPDDGFLAGRVIGLHDVITFEGQTQLEIEQAFRDSIDDYLDFCAERGEQPQVFDPDADKDISAVPDPILPHESKGAK